MFNKTAIESYFRGEKQESLLFLVLGVSAIILSAIYFFFLSERFYKGAAIPLVLIGVLLAVVGISVYNRSDGDRDRNVRAFEQNSSQLKLQEVPRMEKVMRSFVIYRYTEIFLLLAGAGIYLYFIRDFENDYWRGFGMALAIMALLALIADYFAEKRGRKYLEGLKDFVERNA